ncbi:hypothetical protein H4R18_004642 [Coemansia javaensis]|uniref:GRIP domain-containing protein n=1 Tax=Coemansia javaensis TaxID=2761396 RepID=A0A9W8H8G4_9FUNG|nr:hypothetical protein H4R18_004642 [Coemansia javaensis]
MPTNDELQKRVGVLQQQLRKAGDHLKRLAAENSALTEEVERLSARKPEAARDDGDEASRLREWESEAGDWAAVLGLAPAGAQGPAVLRLIRERIAASNASDSDAERLVHEIAQMRLDGAREAESKRALEERLAALEGRLESAAADEAALARALDGLAAGESIPDTVPEGLRPGLERLRQGLQQKQPAQPAASESSKAKNDRIRELSEQLGSAQAELATATAAREELGRDYDLLLERIGTMRDALKAKMNAESDELKRLRAEAAAAAEALAQQREESDRCRGLCERQRAELDQAQRALWECQESASRAQYEQQQAAAEHERRAVELQARLGAAEDQLASDTAQHARLEERVEQLQSELNRALNAESQWVEEQEVHLVTIQNLQSALEALQEAKDADVDIAVERLRDELRAAAAAQRAAEGRAEQAEGRLRQAELSGATAEQCQHTIAAQAGELERLRREVAVLKDHLNESMRRLREESSEFNLDKRVITNLVVGFLALPYGDPKRFEILQLMSSILQFSEEQQAKVGLIRKAGRRAPLPPQSGASSSNGSEPNGAAPPLPDTKDSFSDQWISFLLRESSRGRA